MFVQKNILGWREVCSMSRMKNFIKKETVLSIAILLAVISAFLVLPDRQYLDYIDFRTLGILFSLMDHKRCVFDHICAVYDCIST